jgi:caffeoyl-CoA O-methyltransferase
MAGPLPRSLVTSPEILDYVAAHSDPADAVLRSLTEETATLGGVSRMQIGSDQSAFLTMLTRLTGARRAIEIGTFTGTSALAIGRGLPDDGRLLCLDVNDRWTSIGRRHWEMAGVSDRIELRLGPALDTIAAFGAGDGPFDLAFVDADKPNYLAYVHALVPHLRAGSLVAVDNTLWDGRVVDPAANDADTAAIKAFNDAVVADDRFDTVLTTIGDGVTLLRVR